MADNRSRCVGLIVVLLVWGFTAALPISLQVKRPDDCSIEIQDGQTQYLDLSCKITSANINDVLRVIKNPHIAQIILGISPEFSQFNFDDESFHPNLQSLDIVGNMFSISSGAFRGLSKLKQLKMSKFITSDSLFYKQNIKMYPIVYGINTTTYPLNINATAPVFGAGWLTPLTNLKELTIFNSNISSFRVEEFCTLKQLQTLDLSNDRINSTEGLGIICNSSSCTPCLPHVTLLNISGNPIRDFTLNVSRDLPSLNTFDFSHCNLSVFYLNIVTSESIRGLIARDNNLHSLLIDEEYPCGRPDLLLFTLRDNQLQAISPDLFLCMPKLMVLSLSGNSLTGETLIIAGLNNLTELLVLDLSFNNITQLQPALIGNMTKLKRFSCSSCSLTTIDHDTFIYTQDLSILLLNDNKLAIIEAGSFSHFSNLILLNLSGNTLNAITLTENLYSLLLLDLSDNQLLEIPDFNAPSLNLSILEIDRNQITHIGPEQLHNLTKLKYLSLAFNNIQYIPDNTFANQNVLEKLILSGNRIRTFLEFGFDGLPNLTHLSLDNNFLIELPPLKSRSLGKLMFLNISRNLIRTMNLQNGRSLRGIDLSHNRISELRVSLLSFEHIQYVNYSFNHIKTVEYKDFLTEIFPRPKVYLQGNPLHVDCYSDWLLDDKSDKSVGQIRDERRIKNKYKPVDKGLNDPLLGEYYAKIADLDLLQFTTATGESKFFHELANTDFLCPFTEICHVSECRPSCCRCFPQCMCLGTSAFASYTQTGSIVDSSYMNCSSRNMTDLPSGGPVYVRYLILEGNHLNSMNLSNFPYLLVLNAANSHISHLPPGGFWNQIELVILDLQQNNLEKISKETFAFLPMLEKLYLQDNKIQYIENGSFDAFWHLKVLWLHGNHLKSFLFTLIEKMNPHSQLTLHNNQWSCDCEFGPVFKQWLIQSHIIVNRSHIYCNNTVLSEKAYSSEPDTSQYNMTNTTGITALPMHHLAVIDIDFTECTNRTVVERVHHHTVHHKSITEIVSLAAVVVVVAIFILVIFKTRLLLRVWFYNKFGLRFRQEEEDNDDKPYDLFIAYAKVDERLVVRELLPELEEQQLSYKVCLECRDWHPGTTTTDAVVASVQLSKRTIVLVSPNHLDTQWCEYAFDAAHYQVLKDKQIRLILVLTDIELKARMTQAMKLYMKTNTFLVIGEKWFWKKLKYYLADNPRGADHVVGREFSLMNAY